MIWRLPGAQRYTARNSSSGASTVTSPVFRHGSGVSDSFPAPIFCDRPPSGRSALTGTSSTPSMLQDKPVGFSGCQIQSFPLRTDRFETPTRAC
jgi:hypothetical protein